MRMKSRLMSWARIRKKDLRQVLSGFLSPKWAIHQPQNRAWKLAPKQTNLKPSGRGSIRDMTRSDLITEGTVWHQMRVPLLFRAQLRLSEALERLTSNTGTALENQKLQQSSAFCQERSVSNALRWSKSQPLTSASRQSAIPLKKRLVLNRYERRRGFCPSVSWKAQPNPLSHDLDPETDPAADPSKPKTCTVHGTRPQVASLKRMVQQH